MTATILTELVSRHQQLEVIKALYTLEQENLTLREMSCKAKRLAKVAFKECKREVIEY